MDITNFINCDSIVKDEIVRTNGWIKIEDRFYSFEDDNGWTLVKWRDDLTCIFTYGKKTEIILFKVGKKILSQKYSIIENPKLLSACLELFSIQEKFTNREFANV